MDTYHVIITYLPTEYGSYKTKHLYATSPDILAKTMEEWFTTFDNPLQPLIVAHITHIGS